MIKNPLQEYLNIGLHLSEIKNLLKEYIIDGIT